MEPVDYMDPTGDDLGETTPPMAQPGRAFPGNWMIAPDFDPNDHLMNLKGRDYLNVQSRLLWFIRDQRALIAAGLAREPYVLRTELIELDREAGWAHFKTVARDVLGNESVMYGSEAAKDFTDYIEKASTKSLGRALLGLGYGTAFAPEMDEGERIVDAPRERRDERRDERRTSGQQSQGQGQQRQQNQQRQAQPPGSPARQAAQPQAQAQQQQGKPQGNPDGITDQQRGTIERLAKQLHREVPATLDEFTSAQAGQWIRKANDAIKQAREAAAASS